MTKPMSAHRREICWVQLKRRGQASVCFYCNRSLTKHSRSLDHVVCRSKNGGHNVKNLVATCISCNNGRGNLDFIEFGIASILKNNFSLMKKTLHIAEAGRKEIRPELGCHQLFKFAA